jgi:hypothetical protein
MVGKKVPNVAEATEAMYSTPTVVLSNILLIKVENNKRMTETLRGHVVIQKRLTKRTTRDASWQEFVEDCEEGARRRGW